MNCVSVHVLMQGFRVSLCEGHVERVVLLCAKRDDILFLSLAGQSFLSLREPWQNAWEEKAKISDSSLPLRALLKALSTMSTKESERISSAQQTLDSMCVPCQ